MGINKRNITFRDRSRLESRKKDSYCFSRFSCKEYGYKQKTLLIFLPKEDDLMYSQTVFH